VRADGARIAYQGASGKIPGGVRADVSSLGSAQEQLLLSGFCAARALLKLAGRGVVAGNPR
jgi:hypothetical protein